MPQTQFKGYETQVTGSDVGTWGDVLNANMITFADLNVGGITSKTGLTNVDVTLTATEARSAMLRLSGTLTGNIIVTSSAQGFYCVENLTTGNFSVTLSNTVASVVLPQSYRGLVYADINNGPRIYGTASTTNPNVIVTGTQMYFFNAAAPTGWTLVTSLNNYALKLSSSAGGVTAGTVDYTTVYGRSTTDGHVLTNAEVPAHNHGLTVVAIGPNGSQNTTPHWQGRPVGSAGPATGTTDTMTSGGDAHTHDMDMRVLTVTTIICSRSN